MLKKRRSESGNDFCNFGVLLVLIGKLVSSALFEVINEEE